MLRFLQKENNSKYSIGRNLGLNSLPMPPVSPSIPYVGYGNRCHQSEWEKQLVNVYACLPLCVCPHYPLSEPLPLWTGNASHCWFNEYFCRFARAAQKKVSRMREEGRSRRRVTDLRCLFSTIQMVLLPYLMAKLHLRTLLISFP